MAGTSPARTAVSVFGNWYEYPIAATSSFSKDFQTFPRKFQAFPRKFQAFPNLSKDFQIFFLGRFEENQGLIARSARNRVFSEFPRRLGRDERPRGALPNALAIQGSANSDYRKEIVGGDFREGPRGERGITPLRQSRRQPLGVGCTPPVGHV
jgi:hypothetical protein